MAELTQEQLEHLVLGSPSPPRVSFFETAVLDVEASRDVGARVYTTKTYIRKVFPGVTDGAAYEATPADTRGNPEEYQRFLASRQGVQEPPIDFLPGLTMAHRQELIDYGLATMPALASAVVVPQHLEYARLAAIKVMAVLTGEETYDNEKIHSQARQADGAPGAGIEGHGTGILPGAGIEGHGTGIGDHSGRQGQTLTGAMRLADRRQVNPSPLLQREPDGGPAGGSGEAGEGLRPGGQEYRHQGLSADFDLVMTYR